MSALPLPRSRPALFVLGMVVFDLPVLLAVGVLGWFYGYAHTYEEIAAWRAAHLWSLIPSVVVAGLFVRRMFR